MNKFKKLSIIIPVYNEEKFIADVIKTVFQAESCGLRKEVIVVNDGSTDKTASILLKLKKKYPDVTYINSKKNEGKGASLKKGLLQSRGDIVLIQDSDFEYSPRDYVLLLDPFLTRGADVVYGSRLVTTQPHRVLFFWHYRINLFLTFISNMLTGLNLTDMETGSKVFSGPVIREIAPFLRSKRFGFEPEVTARIAKKKGLKIFEVGISYSGRTYEEGKKIGWKDGLLALWEIFRYNIFT